MTDAYDKMCEFERMATELAVTFINLPAEQVDAHIESALRRLVLFLGFDRATLVQHAGNGRPLASHCWGKPGYPILTEYSFAEEYPYIYGTMEKSKEVLVFSADSLPSDAAKDAEMMRCYGPPVMVCLPLLAESRNIGLITVGTFASVRPSLPEMLNCLPLLGTILANALLKKSMELSLKQAFMEVTRLKNLMEAENCLLHEDLGNRCLPLHNMVGESKALKRLLRQIKQVADTDSTVLILGETGTGKELVARSIHNMSGRSKRAMLSVNCAGFAPSLMESELFGHEKGAFTGAISRKMGRFEVADGSSLFFDEVGELSVSAQAKLLRVLQEKQFERVGSSRPVHVDVRILAATNRDLEVEMLEGRFREDLFYRLNVFPITVPPLRERLEDIPLMVKAFVAELNVSMGKDIRQVNSNDLKVLHEYPWPGNVRELRNVVERAMILASGSILRISLPERRDREAAVESLAEAERRHILAALEKTDGRISGEKGAARLLRINPKTLESRMKRLNISRTGQRRPADGA